MRIRGPFCDLRTVAPDDAAFILSLRLDDVRNKFLSPVRADIAAQAEWLREYQAREAAGAEFYFAIEAPTGTAVGTVRVYDFVDDSFSWGSWVIRPGVSPHVAVASALLVYEFAFGQLGFAQSHFEVLKGNDRVIAFHRRLNAETVREDDRAVYFVLTREAYEAVREKYRKYLHEPAIPSAR